MNVKEMLTILQDEKIHTWFDLCLFIDRFKENRKVPSINFTGSYHDFKKYLAEGGIAFITFLYSIDGATMEIGKYAKVFNLIFEDIKLNFIGGEFHEIGEILNQSNYKHYQLDAHDCSRIQ